MELYYDQVGVQDLTQAVIQQRAVMRGLIKAEGMIPTAREPRSSFNEAAMALRYTIPLAWGEGPIDELLTQALQHRRALRRHYTAVADSFADFVAAYHGSYEKAPKVWRAARYRKSALETLDRLERVDQQYITMTSMEVDLDELLNFYVTVDDVSVDSVLYEARRARERYLKEPTVTQLQRCVELFDPERLLASPEAALLKLDSSYRKAPIYAELCAQHDSLSVAAILRTAID